MPDPRIDLKDPRIAGVLAWLIPGAGHFYQGRHFKGAIYSSCILGLFLTGWAMADWSAVQPPDLRRPTANKTLLLKYTAQLGVGLPSLYGLVQSKRFLSPSNATTTQLDAPVEAEFEGVFLEHLFPAVGNVGDLLQRLRYGHEHPDEDWPLDRGQPVQGRLTLRPVQTDLGTAAIETQFTGTIAGEPRELKLDYATLEEPIRASPHRRVFALAREPASGRPRGILVASIPRPFLNRVGVPMSPREENQLHARHGNFLEIWMVFTWVAGLLNMLAVWDACQGPAYAYGDEPPEEEAPSTDGGSPTPAPAASGAVL